MAHGGMADRPSAAVGLIPWIDNFSHIGGLVGGFLAGLVVLTEERPAGRPLYTKILSGTPSGARDPGLVFIDSVASRRCSMPISVPLHRIINHVVARHRR